MRRSDHNHLRITRILRSLRVLGLEAEAKAFYDALTEVFDASKGHIGQKSMMFWTRAVSRPLHLAPDVESDESEGEGFLYDHDEILAAAAKALGGSSVAGNGTGNAGEDGKGGV